MLGLSPRDFRIFLIFSAVVMTMPIWMSPIHGSVSFYQLFAVFGLFTIGFNLLFGLTGYLSFGHAAMYGTGSIAAFWCMKLLSLHALPAILFGGVAAGILALVMGFLCLRRSGIYFSILTLAFAVMMYQLAIPQKTLTGGDDTIGLDPGKETIFENVQVPVMAGDAQAVDADGNLRFRTTSQPKINPETGEAEKRWKDARILDRAIGLTPDTASPNFGIPSLKVQIKQASIDPQTGLEVTTWIDARNFEGEEPLTPDVNDPDLGLPSIADSNKRKIYHWFSLNRDGKLTSKEVEAWLASKRVTRFLQLDHVVHYIHFQYQTGATVGFVLLIIGFYFSIRVRRSAFGLMLRAVKTNQTRMGYTGLQPKRYTLAVFVISGIYAGMAGALWTVLTSQTTAERLIWNISGEVVIMTILGGVGTLVGPVIGAGLVEYLKELLSAINIEVSGFWTALIKPFLGDTWLLTLGLVFMAVVAFLPGGLMELPKKIMALINRMRGKGDAS